MNILDYLRADQFPGKSIRKWYTKTAKTQLTLYTRDYKTIESDGSSKISKQDTLLQLNLTVNKKAMRTEQQYDRAFYALQRLVEELNAIHSRIQTYIDERRAGEDGGIVDDIPYYEAQMVQIIAQANQFQDGAVHSMQQHDQ
ncbi:hypothetical protein D1007_15083 [Hordeum vulgare]|nr:hypothetical protein D1007_15083 [Hordeum vulgare]